MKQREIKFRVWDTLAKHFIYPDKGYQGHYVMDLSGNFQNLQNGAGGSEMIVQQWTGIKDACGIDIYEGDLIKYPYPSDHRVSEINSPECRNVVLVRWSEEGQDNHPGWVFVDLMSQGGPMEVVGNIFENEDLIK